MIGNDQESNLANGSGTMNGYAKIYVFQVLLYKSFKESELLKFMLHDLTCCIKMMNWGPVEQCEHNIALSLLLSERVHSHLLTGANSAC